MKFLNFKFGKNKVPKLSSIKPVIFDVNQKWFILLALSSIIFIVTALVALNLFRMMYLETYKTTSAPEDINGLLNIDKLKSSIERRETSRTQAFEAPQDPASR